MVDMYVVSKVIKLFLSLFHYSMNLVSQRNLVVPVILLISQFFFKF